MQRILGTALLLTAVGVISAAPAPKSGDKITMVDLKDHINVKSHENLHSDRFEKNNLDSLPTGNQTFAKIPFHIDKGVVQLGSSVVEKKPVKIEGIRIGRAVSKLHFLHACGYSTEDGKVVGKYVVRYEDKTTKEIEIVYGTDVIDWWHYPGRALPTKGKLGWEGENEASKGFEANIKLYVMTWENPNKDSKVISIDFVNTAPDTGCAPFCVAITAEK